MNYMQLLQMSHFTSSITQMLFLSYENIHLTDSMENSPS